MKILELTERREYMATSQIHKNVVNEGIIKNISKAVNGLSYGTITITVHDSKIVQIEVAQKSRFDDVWTVQEGGGI